ncbi:MAG: hypothetical protein ACT4PO_07475 [Actinomycetota bacterium]
MDAYVIALRIVHILAGAFWVGASAMIFLFIQPSARELSPRADGSCCTSRSANG